MLILDIHNLELVWTTFFRKSTLFIDNYKITVVRFLYYRRYSQDHTNWKMLWHTNFIIIALKQVHHLFQLLRDFE